MEGDSKSGSRFITKTKIRRKENSTLKSSLQPTSGNVFIEIQPAVLEFSGFEIGKLYTLPLKIINKAPVSQRINVLPLESQCFSFKIDKKGEISTGLHELVEVQFIPREYKYYKDFIRINTQTDNFQIPIHGYPILMTKEELLRVIPKIIDFGTINVGQTQTNTYVLNSKVPVDFEFQFVYKKESPQIKIQPIKGIIKAEESIQINIEFAPLNKVTYTAEVYLNISQYGFEPVLISVFGSGKQKELKPVKNARPKSSKNQKQLNSSVNTNKPLLQSKRLSTIKIQSKQPKQTNQQNQSRIVKQSVKDFTKSLIPVPPKRPGSARKLTSTINFKPSLLQTLQQSSMNHQNQKRRKQKQFIEHFNQVQTTDKQKQIKFAVYFGDSPLTQARIQQIKQERINQKYQFLKNIELQASQRCFMVENKSASAIDYHTFPIVTPTFNKAKNDQLKKRQKLLERFNIAASKVLITNRMIKRLKKIQNYIQSNKDKESPKSIHTTRYSQTISQQLNGVSFEAKQKSFTLSSLKLQFDQAANINKQILQINATTEFDDSAPIDLLEGFQPEILKYDKITYPPVYINPPTTIPSQRQGAEEEYAIRGPAVPIPSTPLRLNLYSLPPKLPFYKYIVDHPTIKFNQKPNLCNELSIDYLFQNINRVDDQYAGWSDGDLDALKYKFMKGTDIPYTTINGIVNVNGPYDIGYIKNIAQYCPPTLQRAEPDDPYSQQDSDNQQYPTLSVPNLLEYTKKIQGESKQLKQKRQKIYNQLGNSIKQIDNNLGELKIKQLSIVPTLQNDLNKKILDKANKLVIT